MSRRVWNKGFTKDTHPSVLKISETMKRKKIDNFAAWRDKEVRSGRIRIYFSPLPKNGDLAELIGVVLGDGHIERFPRTERLLIFSNANNHGFVRRYAALVEKLFKKKPYIYTQSGQNCTRISLYENRISARLGVPTGARKDIVFRIPPWIFRKRSYVVRHLRGLYEAEGSHSVHKPTSTYKLNFSNKNQSLLKNVTELLTVLGLSSHRDSSRVQISKRRHVERAIEILQFRKY